jgi:hypothetical protein
LLGHICQILPEIEQKSHPNFTQMGDNFLLPFTQGPPMGNLGGVSTHNPLGGPVGEMPHHFPFNFSAVASLKKEVF